MSAFRETHLRTGISVKNLEKYHYEMITSMRLLLGGLKEERHETERRVSELVASNEQLRRIVADQITESNKAYRSIIWRFFILITGILMGVGVYRIATV